MSLAFVRRLESCIRGRPWFRFQGHLFYLRPMLAVCALTAVCASVRDILPFANGLARALFFLVPVCTVGNYCIEEEPSARSRPRSSDGKRLNFRLMFFLWFLACTAYSIVWIATWMAGVPTG